MCHNICDILHDICSTTKILDQIDQETSVTVTVDGFGNIDITDPDGELIPELSQGNLSGTGGRAQRFYLDRFGNFKYTIN
jgi:hypothetical protein